MSKVKVVDKDGVSVPDEVNDLAEDIQELLMGKTIGAGFNALMALMFHAIKMTPDASAKQYMLETLTKNTAQSIDELPQEEVSPIIVPEGIIH